MTRPTIHRPAEQFGKIVCTKLFAQPGPLHVLRQFAVVSMPNISKLQHNLNWRHLPGQATQDNPETLDLLPNCTMPHDVPHAIGHVPRDYGIVAMVAAQWPGRNGPEKIRDGLFQHSGCTSSGVAAAQITHAAERPK
jgi:hypothetical protein